MPGHQTGGEYGHTDDGRKEGAPGSDSVRIGCYEDDDIDILRRRQHVSARVAYRLTPVQA